MSLRASRSPKPSKSAMAYRTISEVAREVGVPQHVLRFWETKFAAVRPLKRSGNRRYYRPEDVAVLHTIRTLLYDEGFTIKGVQKRFRDQGLRATVAECLQGSAATAVPERAEPPAPPAQADAADPPPAGIAPDRLRGLLKELKAIRAQLRQSPGEEA
ncbi:MAG: MerR family transcriptional regulator [Rhodothalassiaceae bacterium]